MEETNMSDTKGIENGQTARHQTTHLGTITQLVGDSSKASIKFPKRQTMEIALERESKPVGFILL